MAPGAAHPGDRLRDEPGRPPGGVRRAPAQAGVQDLARARGHGEQGVVAAGVGVGELRPPGLLQAVGLADGRVEIDGERGLSRPGTRGPGPGEQLPTHRVELQGVTPGEGAQEGAEGRGGADLHAENRLGRTRAQESGVIDTVTPGERGEDEAHGLHACVARSRAAPETHLLVDERAQPQPLGERGGQDEARVGHGVAIGEGYLHPIQTVGRLHLTGAFLFGITVCFATHIFPGKRALVCYLLPDFCARDRWIRG